MTGEKKPGIASSLLALLVFGVIASFSIYFSGAFIWSLPFERFADDICNGSDVWCGTTFLRWLVCAFIASMVGIPVMWFAVMRFHARSVRDQNDWGEFLFDLTTTAVPLFVLGLAMLLELPKLRAAFSQEAISAGAAYDAVGAVAGIMILYALTLLGAFVFDKLATAKNQITEANDEAVSRLKTASTWLGLQQRLAAGREHAPAPAQAVEKMLEAWADIHHPDGGASASASGSVSPGRDDVASACLSTLLEAYAEEETIDISGELPWYRVHPSVWPPGVSHEKDAAKGRASFFATNVGFYATFLGRAVNQLEAVGKSSELSPCVAVVTNVLPSHWWNWPVKRGDNAIYPPIVQYRRAQEEFVRRGGQIFRRVVVLGESEDPLSEPQLYSFQDDQVIQELNDAQLFWHERGSSGKPILLAGATEDPELNTALLANVLGAKDVEWRETTPNQQSAVVGSLKAQNSWPRERPMYWVFDKAKVDSTHLCLCQDPSAHPNGECRLPLLDHYAKTMHGGHGGTEVYSVGRGFLRSPLGASKDPGLNGCPDIMFLGLSKPELRVWDDSTPLWGCALMATMAPLTETMFLTVIRSSSDISNLWNSVKGVFNQPNVKIKISMNHKDGVIRRP